MRFSSGFAVEEPAADRATLLRELSERMDGLQHQVDGARRVLAELVRAEEEVGR
jgi:hypothetical protein